MYKARYWQKISDDQLQCNICPRHCKLREGQRGFCFVRQNINNEIILTTYGRSSGFCIDPIEKKPLNHFFPGTSILSFGTAGCNLGCKFCQNWDISTAKKFNRLVEKASPQDIAITAEKHKCKSVAFTYNDPVIFMEYGVDVAKECHKRGIKTVAVTAGYICDEPRKDFFSYIDAANVDLKSFSDDFYKKMCLGSLQPVLDTLNFLANETNVWLEITTLLIPGLNDSDEEIDQMTEWIYDNLGYEIPLHFSAFHPCFNLTDREPTSMETLIKAREIAINNGLRYVYTGNVFYPEGERTFCSECKKILIERNRYTIIQYNLKDINKCKYCNAECAGFFDNKPGTWGAQCMPLHIN